MGRTCRVCGRERAHEQFGGKGMRAVICRRCRHRPKEAQRLGLATDEVYSFLDQSNISAINIKRLGELESIDNAGFQTLRVLVLEIAKVHPRKRRRWKFLKEKYPELLTRIVSSERFDYLLDEASLHAHDLNDLEH